MVPTPAIAMSLAWNDGVDSWRNAGPGARQDESRVSPFGLQTCGYRALSPFSVPRWCPLDPSHSSPGLVGSAFGRALVGDRAELVPCCTQLIGQSCTFDSTRSS